MKQMKIVLLLILFIAAGCSKKEKYQSINLPEGMHRIIVKEHIKAAGYTYLRADDNGKEQWLAILEMPVQDGDTFYYSDAIEMKNFKSKTLNRTFESIIFVNGVSKTINGTTAETTYDTIQYHKTVKKDLTGIKVKPPANGKTISFIIKNKKRLKGKTVKLRGVVTKYNSDILDRNWIHLKDGTGFKNRNDILVTTKDKAHIGDTVIAEGTLVLDKDFGAGYFYKVLIENATVTVE